MKIIKAKQEQIENIIQIGIKSYKEHFSEIWTAKGIDEYLSLQFDFQKISNEMNSDNTKYFVSYFENRVVGIVKINLKKQIPNSSVERGIELEKIYLLSQFAGKGFGTTMLDFTIKYAKDNGENVIWLDVLKTNLKAIKFYERYGFKIIDQLDFATDKIKTDMWVMKCDLA